jgi:hypothetical protein
VYVCAGIVLFLLISYLFRKDEKSIVFWKRVSDWIGNYLARPIAYSKEAGRTKEFREEIIKHIRSSRKVYFKLVSAHTMFYSDDEKYILEALQSLSPEVRGRKDIRFQLWDTESRYWKERAFRYLPVLKGDPRTPSVSGLDAYKDRCKDIVEQIKNSIGGEPVLYERYPTWRIFIFDRAVFVSHYVEDFEEGHKTQCVKFPVKNGMYAAFLQHFMSLYKDKSVPVASQ